MPSADMEKENAEYGEVLRANCVGNCQDARCPVCFPKEDDGGKVFVSEALMMVEDSPEPPDDYENYDALTPFEVWQHDSFLQILSENQAIVGEVRSVRAAIAELREYVTQLEEKAAEMASPEKMQEAMQKMMGGGLF